MTPNNDVGRDGPGGQIDSRDRPWLRNAARVHPHILGEWIAALLGGKLAGLRLWSAKDGDIRHRPRFIDNGGDREHSHVDHRKLLTRLGVEHCELIIGRQRQNRESLAVRARTTCHRRCTRHKLAKPAGHGGDDDTVATANRGGRGSGTIVEKELRETLGSGERRTAR